MCVFSSDLEEFNKTSLQMHGCMPSEGILSLPKFSSCSQCLGYCIKFSVFESVRPLTLNIREIISFSKFKRTVYAHLLELDNNSHICSL